MCCLLVIGALLFACSLDFNLFCTLTLSRRSGFCTTSEQFRFASCNNRNDLAKRCFFLLLRKWQIDSDHTEGCLSIKVVFDDVKCVTAFFFYCFISLFLSNSCFLRKLLLWSIYSDLLTLTMPNFTNYDLYDVLQVLLIRSCHSIIKNSGGWLDTVAADVKGSSRVKAILSSHGWLL